MRMRSGFERAFGHSSMRSTETGAAVLGPGKRSEADRLHEAAARARNAEERERVATATTRKIGRRGASGGARIETSHRQLKLVAGVQDGRGRAIAYQGGRKFLEADGPDPAAAVEQLKRLIDEIHEHRETSRDGSAPSTEEYADALIRVDRFINAVQRTALIRHASRPGSRAFLAQMAAQVGVGPEEMQRGYVRLGRYLGDILNFRPEREDLGKLVQPVLVLAEPAKGVSGDLEWVLRESLVAAIHLWAGRAKAASA